MRTTLGPVVEQHPAQCPNGHNWNRAGAFLVGWDSLNYSGARRMWICQTCGERVFAEVGAKLTVPLTEHNKYFPKS